MKKETPILFSTPMVQALLAGRKSQTRRIVKPQPLYKTYSKYVMPDDAPKKWHDCEDVTTICPHGEVGGILYVRETWRWAEGFSGSGWYEYKASNTDPLCTWRPSIHMPKSAARIWLEITDIRVERLQEISEGDAVAEGIEDLTEGKRLSFKDYLKGVHPLTAKASFKSLWESINGPESWEANPFCWVIKFKVLSTAGKPENS